MAPLLYSELVPFYHLLDPLADHEGEAEEFGAVLTDAVPHRPASLLELGAGAGHGAYFVKTKFATTTLVDVSPAMRERSQRLNPDCEHIDGDMRTLRLGRTFDSVLIHDAIDYITSREDLLATVTTAFTHLRPQGAALFIPDHVRESFKESCEDHAGDDDDRGLRALSWSYDPRSDDDTYLVDFAFLLRERGEVRAVHDRHELGLFDSDTWVQVCKQAGFDVRVIARPLSAADVHSGYTNKMFLCAKAAPSPR